MEVVGWWFLERIVGRAVERWSRPVLGMFLGKGYRTLRDDFRAVEKNPGQGDAVSRLIVRAPTTLGRRKIDHLYHSFMAQPHRYMEERVFVSYWMKQYKLEGVETIGELFQRLSAQAVHHGQKTEDPLFWERCLRENHIPTIAQELMDDVKT